MALRPLLVAALLVALPLAGCVAGPADPSGSPGDGSEGTAPRPEAALASQLHDLSEVDPDIDVTDAVVEQMRVPGAGTGPSGDAPRIDVWIGRPPTDDPVPVVLTVTPYYGGGNPMETGHEFGRLGEILIPRGYAVGVVSVRGTGNSEGCFTQGGPTEARDTAAVIEAVGEAGWSNGRVGLIGVSYDGTTPQDVWVEGPDHLETIVPIAGISDMYKYNFVRGVPINVQGFGFNTYYWALVGASPVGLAGGSQTEDPGSMPGAIAGEACPEQADVQQGGVTSTVDGNKDSYWQVRDFLAELRARPDAERASVFYIHGLQDWNVKPHNMRGWLPAIQDQGVPFKAWLGQWGHAWPQGDDCRDNGSACRADWWEHAMVAWFDEFLKDRETGILDAPAVQVQSDDGVWRHEAAWPPADRLDLTLHPRADGSLGDRPGNGSVTYHDRQGGVAPATEASSPGQAVWVSEPLTEDLHIAGVPRLVADVTASGHRASLMLTLAERTEAGDRSFNFAAQSLNHVGSLASGQPSIAGRTQRVEVPFFPQDDVVHEGSRLVLIAAGNLVPNGEPAPSLQPVSDGSEITIDLEDARLELPVDPTVVPETPQPYGNVTTG